jgi:hypothetical protein
MLIKKTPNIDRIQGTNIIRANKIGNNTVQQNPINWSKRILGNEALTQININTIIELFIPKVILCNNPFTDELDKADFKLKYCKDSIQSISNI